MMASIFGEYNRKWLIVPLPPAVEWGTFVKVHREQTSPSTCCTQLTWYPFDNAHVIFSYEPTTSPDMEFVQKFTPPDFQAKSFTLLISPNFNSFSGKKHKKLVKMEKLTPLAKILH